MQRLFVLPSGAQKREVAFTLTISHWIMEAIREAYCLVGQTPPEGLRAHSTWAVSSSWASVAADQICRAATWASRSTFVKHC